MIRPFIIRLIIRLKMSHIGNVMSVLSGLTRPLGHKVYFLAENGVSLRVWGNGWEHMTAAHSNLKIEQKPVYDQDYVMAVAHSKINLCFLRRVTEICKPVGPLKSRPWADL